jgi:hypothetical protein
MAAIMKGRKMERPIKESEVIKNGCIETVLNNHFTHAGVTYPAECEIKIPRSVYDLFAPGIEKDEDQKAIFYANKKMKEEQTK